MKILSVFQSATVTLSLVDLITGFGKSVCLMSIAGIVIANNLLIKVVTEKSPNFRYREIEVFYNKVYYDYK